MGVATGATAPAVVTGADAVAPAVVGAAVLSLAAVGAGAALVGAAVGAVLGAVVIDVGGAGVTFAEDFQGVLSPTAEEVWMLIRRTSGPLHCHPAAQHDRP